MVRRWVAAVGEPSLEVGLRELGEGELLGVDPVEQFQGYADAGAYSPGGARGGCSPGGVASCAAKEVPGGEGADEVGLVGGSGGEQLVEPGFDPVEIVVPVGQNAGVHEQVAGVAFAVAGWLGIEVVVGDGPAAVGEPGKQSRRRAVGQPPDDGQGFGGLYERLL
jgi:hypothetical protein